MNMRRILKEPRLRTEDGGSVPTNAMPVGLRLRDGGEVSPWSLKGMARSVQGAFTKTPKQMADAAAKAEYVARAAAARAAPAPAPASVPATAPTNTVQSTQNEFNGVGLAGRMKAAGLRDGGTLRTDAGGHVPGKGSGDKIPALYEPGEFVVSNDMLEAEPSLRSELHSLRTQVLAKKGMTPAQADEKAVQGGATLRANSGVTYETDQYGIPTKSRQAGMGPAPSVVPQAVSGTPGGNSPGNSGGNPAIAPGFLPALRGTQAAIASDIQNNSNKGNYAGVVGNLLTALPRYGGAAVDDIIANPIRTLNNTASRPTAGVIANVAAGAAGTELSPEAQKMLEPSKPTSPSQAPSPRTPQNLPQASYSNEGRHTPALPGVNSPYGNIQGTRDFTKDLASVPANLPSDLRDGMVYKTRDAKGNVTYSGRNVTGDVSNKMLNGDGTSAGPMRGSVRDGNSVAMGPNGSYVIDDQAKTMSREQIAQVMTNPDGSTWSAQDNAIMAANLRDGIDKYRGTSRQPMQDEEERIPAIGEFGHNKAVAAKLARDQIKATLRGQDITSADNRLSTEASRNRLRYDMDKDQRDYATQRADKNFEQRQAARKAMDDRITAKFVDKEGKPDLARAAEYKGAVSSTLAALAAEARAQGDVARANKLATADYSSMDSEDEAMIQQLWDAKESARANATWYNGKFVDDKNLLSYRPNGVRKNLVLSSNVKTQNGSELNVNDARDQGIFGGPGSSNLDPYLAQARKIEEQRLRGTQGR